MFIVYDKLKILKIEAKLDRKIISKETIVVRYEISSTIGQ